MIDGYQMAGLVGMFLTIRRFSGDCSWRARASHQKKGGFFVSYVLRPSGDWITPVIEGKVSGVLRKRD